ncbi:N-acetyltransferase [Pelagibius sp.]|uniref:GNAT family N-acetyltransferase n=1 Tax=Pelagibius sp. TaxID=1931238 RepID=UPI002621F1B3|nr:GNAT family N-acetyltransferase [Pelagibius sp.]
MTAQPHSAPSIRAATAADVPFLARAEFEASLPPFGRSFWDDLLKESGTGTLEFLESKLREEAASWGAVEDFIVLEVEGTSAAACAVFAADEHAEQGPLNLDRLDRVAAALSWTAETAAAFRAAYQGIWSGGAEFLKPQAELIVESVAVAPEFRGRGLGHALMRAAFDKAQGKGAASLGIMVIHGNDAAKALYEKYFDPYTTFHAAYFDHAFPGLTKFRANLVE